MAAKSKAVSAPKKVTAAKVANKAKAAPRGLQLTTAQQAAYNKAFSATAQKLSNAARTRAFATGLRKYRLQAANSTVRKYNVARASTQAASVAAHAASQSLAQSKAGHQNLALQRRIGADAFRHTTLLGRMQFAQAGEKAYAHSAVMRTLTQKQAVSIESKFGAKVLKTAVKAARSGRRPTGTPLSKAITAAATTAGNAAAAKVPKTRTAPFTREQVAAASAAFTGYSGEKPKITTTSTGSRQEWVGNEFTPNCVVTAVANHLLYAKSIRITEKEIRELTELAGPEPTIEEVLWQVYLTGWPGRAVHLLTYHDSPWRASPQTDGLVIGYETVTDDGLRDHCALSLKDGQVVSWGQVTERDGEIEEAWELTWQT